MSAAAEPAGAGARILARVVAPLINNNEPESRVIEVAATPFAPVRAPITM